MSNVLNRTTKQFLRSVNTPDYPVVDWIISPDMSAVEGQPSKYLVITGDTVSLMSQSERDAVDEVARLAQIESEVNSISDGVLRRLTAVFVDEANLSRSGMATSAALIDVDALKAAMRAK